MNYMFISDILWYFGHILTGSTIIVNHYNYNLAVIVAFIGQFLTIMSRPIGRLKNTAKYD